MAVSPVEKRLYVARLLVGSGLIVQLLTLLWIHPLAFLAFLFLGIPLVAAGAVFYLYWVLRGAEANPSE
jgi:hypothetical protein